MNKTLKNILIIIAIILGVFIAFKAIAFGISESLSSGAKTLGEAYGTDCEKTKNWEIDEYMIQEYRCIGFAGPHFYPLDLYKNGKRIDEYIFKVDSCQINSQPEKDLFLKIDICNEKITEIRPKKKIILPSKVDSALLFSKKNDLKKVLSQKQINSLIADWNKSEVSDYRDKPLDSIFHPSYHYEIVFYMDSTQFNLRTFNHLVYGETKWVYEMSKYPDTLYFKKLFNSK